MEAAFGFPARQHRFDIADQERIAIGLTVEAETEVLADRTARTGRVDDVTEALVDTVDTQGDAVVGDLRCAHLDTPLARRSDLGQALVEDFLRALLGDVDERRVRRATGVDELPGVDFGASVVGAGGRPGDALVRQCGARAEGAPDVEDVAGLADGFGADGVAFGPTVV